MKLAKTKSIFGHTITVISGDLIGRKILKDGVYDRTGVFFIDRLLRNLTNPVCLDIGANIGNHALVMSRHAGTVIAFEPQPKVFEVLSMNISDNQITNIHACNFGLSNFSGFAKMTVVDAGNTGATSFVSSDASVPSLEAELRQGDQELKRSGVSSVDFIKIDVEGLEASVIDGLRDTITSSSPIIMMEWNCEETRKGFSDKSLFTSVFKDYIFFVLFSSHERPDLGESKAQKIIRKFSRRFLRPSIKLKTFMVDGNYGNVVAIPKHKFEFLSSILS